MDNIISGINVSGQVYTILDPNAIHESEFSAYSGAVDTSLSSKASQTTVDALNDVVTAHTADTSIHLTSGDIETIISSQTADFVTGEELSSYTYDKATIDSKIASGGTFDPTQYYNKTATDELLAEKLDASAYTPTDLSNYYNKQEVDNKIASAKTEIEAEIPSLSGYATEQWVLDKNYITGVDLSNYDTKAEVNSKISEATSGKAETTALTAHTANTSIHVTVADKTAWNNKSDFSGSYDDLTEKPTIPTVPTSNTAFTNDAGYITYEESQSQIDRSISGKQDTLISGTNIKTINNTSILGSGNINIQGGGGKAIEAGRGISITTGETADTVSFNLPISAGTGPLSVAENNDTIASGYWSHAEGAGSSATSYASHAEGKYTLAEGDTSHAEGLGTIAYNFCEHASGRYNNSSLASENFGDSGNTLFSVGNGTGSIERHNAFEIKQDGSIYVSDLNGGSGYSDRPMIKLQDYLVKVWTGTKAQFDAITVKDNDTIYLVTD